MQQPYHGFPLPFIHSIFNSRGCWFQFFSQDVSYKKFGIGRNRFFDNFLDNDDWHVFKYENLAFILWGLSWYNTLHMWNDDGCGYPYNKKQFIRSWS